MRANEFIIEEPAVTGWIRKNVFPYFNSDSRPEKPGKENPPSQFSGGTANAPRPDSSKPDYSRNNSMPNPWREKRFSKSDPKTWPTQGRYSGGIGWRTYKIDGRTVRDFHKGIDIAAPIGTPVYSPIDGVVQASQPTAVDHNGKFVMISGQDKFANESHRFLHLSSVTVSPGQRVFAYKTKIGEVGTSGNSSGPHLHWGVYVNGRYVDPFTL